MTGVQLQSRDRKTLRLTYVGFDGAEFDLLNERGDRERVVRADVGNGLSWRRAVHFPDMRSEATASTGDAQLDRKICDRAAEELVRLEAATSALRTAA